jgi:TrmH family RNA methyltransferase
MKTISSRHNSLVKRIRTAIHDHREEIVVEGPKAVADAIAGGWQPIVIAATAGAARLVPAVAGAVGLELTAEVFESLTGTRQPQGVLGLFHRPRADAAGILARRGTVAIALDAVQDPGNVGTIVRLAAAFDAAGVLLLPGTADPFGAKAIRSSAGAILTVPVAHVTLAELLESGVPLVATAMSGTSVDPPPQNAVLVFGNEGAGVSAELLAHATTIAIPMSERVESLNVATSAAILLARSFALRAVH